MSPSGPRVEVVELTEAPAVRGDEMAEATAETLRTLTRPPSRVAQPARMIFLYSCGGARRNGKSHVRALGSGGGRTRTSNVTTPSSDMSAQPIISSTRSSMSTSIVTVLLAAQRSACFSSCASRWPLPSRSSLANASWSAASLPRGRSGTSECHACFRCVRVAFSSSRHHRRREQ